MTTLLIEKNIPLARKKRIIGRSKYPFINMELNDSFLIPLGLNSSGILVLAKRFCVSNALPWKFKTGKTEDGVRIWRVE